MDLSSLTGPGGLGQVWHLNKRLTGYGTDPGRLRVTGCIFKRKLPSGKISWGYCIDAGAMRTASANRCPKPALHVSSTLISNSRDWSTIETKDRWSDRILARLRNSVRHGLRNTLKQ